MLRTKGLPVIIGVMLVKNESGRYLEKVLTSMYKICHKIIVVDDCSNDNTREICKEFGAEVHVSEKSLWGIDELQQRMRLWNLAINNANNKDWILCLDADEVLEDSKRFVTEIVVPVDWFGQDLDGISFRLFDMWDEKHYRDDEFWNAHNRQWVFMVRYKEGYKYEWSNKKLHCGRFPLNACSNVVVS